MRIVPNSTISLYSGIEIDNGQQLVFSSDASRESYFNNHLEVADVPCTVVRKSGVLRIEVSGVVAARCNYISFINPAFDNKIIYARIIDYDYVNNETVEIVFQIDYWITWCFDLTFEPCYIEREHLSADEWATATANPYDQSIYSLRTPEPSLTIAKELEIPNYSVGSDSDSDAMKVGDLILRNTGVAWGVGTLVCLSSIDFEDLDMEFTSTDPNSPKYKFNAPSNKFVDILTAIAVEPMGYYNISGALCNYLNARYQYNPALAAIEMGSDWSSLGGGATPGLVSRAMAISACDYLYFDPNSLDALELLLEYLTRWSCVSSIVGMYAIPNEIMALAVTFSGGTETMAVYPDTAESLLNTYDNPKLCNYPFSYLRVITPSGDIKELHYEDFIDVQDGSSQCSLNCNLDITTQPSLIVAPYKYKMTNVSDESDVNTMESVIYQQFPTKPYNIDAFLSAVAANAQQVIASRTVDSAWEMASATTGVSKMAEAIQVGKGVASIVGSVVAGNGGLSKGSLGKGLSGLATGGGVGGIAKGLGTAADFFQQGSDLAVQRGKVENATEKWYGASDVLGGGEGAIVADLAATRPAYACDQYIKSNGTGMLNFNLLSFFDIIIQRVRLRSAVLERYDNYFNYYGYQSGRCGIPYVVEYMFGGNNTPHWATIAGKDTTYIKTNDCRITGVMLPVSEYIRAMFNSGVRFIKGD